MGGVNPVYSGKDNLKVPVGLSFQNLLMFLEKEKLPKHS